MADKKTELSIVLRTVDRATAGLRAISKRVDEVTKPIRDFREALGDLRDKSGLGDVMDGFRGVGSAIAGVLGKVLAIGGVVGAAVFGLKSLVDEFDDLGDKAERLGVGVDFLAQMRYAAERTGGSVEALDTGLQGLAKSLGQARAGTGRMASFLEKVSPALLKQLKAAKSNEAAINLLAGAMAKLEDPAKRAALAQATLGDAALAPLFAKGPQGIKELRDRYAELAGSQEGAAAEAGKVDDAMKDLKASTDGIKAALVEGLSPALGQLVAELRAFFSENRGAIAEWSKDFGKKLPGAIHAFVGRVRSALGEIGEFLESIGGVKTVAIALAAILVGPLVSAIATLGIALLTTPVGWIVAGIAGIAAAVAFCTKGFRVLIPVIVAVGAAMLGMPGVAIVAGIVAAATLIVKAWGPIKAFFGKLWDGITAVFEKAWEVIKAIVDGIVGAVKTVTDAIDTVVGGIDVNAMRERARVQATGTPVSDVVAQSMRTIDAARARAGGEARVTVDFANAPPGMRVRTEPGSTAQVDMSVGYNMLPGLP